VEAEITAWFEARSDRSIETACARIFLAGDTAFKVKRHVQLSYVDFSTPERRLWALERELAFNRPAAPDIYRGLRRLTRGADGLELDGDGEAVEHVLEMRRFDSEAVLSAQPQAVDGALAERLGRTVAGFHARAPPRPQGGLKSLAFTIGSNAWLLRELAPRIGAERVEMLIAATQAELERCSGLLEARAAAGFSRLCHGDLHLGNIVLEDGVPILFDCIEFNDLLSDIDVQYDLAFLLMDLEFRGRRAAAARVLSAYLDEAARSFPQGLWTGLAVLPLMLSVRAGVRAHVSGHSGDDAAARAYVDAAIAHLSPEPARLAAVGGLSGSGKSTLSRLIAPALGRSPGAVVLRSDEVRKRLMGARREETLPATAYAPDVDAAVYDALMETGAALLRAGHAVVLDATFRDPDQRRRAAGLAAEAGVRFDGLWLEAPADILAARIAGRSGDASDATLRTLEEQIARGGDVADWIHIDVAGTAEDAAAAWTARHGRLP
jgi:aminoglycoside phosphotransferase family enzyme/predicted kinase